MPQACDPRPLHVEHIVARKHRGRTILSNLALACMACNLCKASNLSGLDPQSGTLTPLFHPRKDDWDDHFAWSGPIVRGKTAIGRTTVEVLNLNDPERVKHRRLLIRLGVFPPTG
jgi:hypothetical protein